MWDIFAVYKYQGGRDGRGGGIHYRLSRHTVCKHVQYLKWQYGLLANVFLQYILCSFFASLHDVNLFTMLFILTMFTMVFMLSVLQMEAPTFLLH